MSDGRMVPQSPASAHQEAELAIMARSAAEAILASPKNSTLESRMEDLKINEVQSDNAHSPHGTHAPLLASSQPVQEKLSADDISIPKQTILFIGDLSRTAVEDQLTDLFSKYGEVIHVDIKRDKLTNNNLGYGFVQFKTYEQAKDAKDALQGYDIAGRPIRVNWAQKNTTLFIGDLDPNIGIEQLQHIFSDYGPIVKEETFVKTGQFGFIKFVNRHDAERAKAEMNRAMIGSRQVRIGWGENSVQKTCVHIQFSPNQVDMISEEALRKHFSQYGTILGVSIPRYMSGRSKGFGFIHYEDDEDGEEAARNAINSNPTFELSGVTIRCNHGKRQVHHRRDNHMHDRHYHHYGYHHHYPPPPHHGHPHHGHHHHHHRNGHRNQRYQHRGGHSNYYSNNSHMRHHGNRHHHQHHRGPEGDYYHRQHMHSNKGRHGGGQVHDSPDRSGRNGGGGGNSPQMYKGPPPGAPNGSHNRPGPPPQNWMPINHVNSGYDPDYYSQQANGTGQAGPSAGNGPPGVRGPPQGNMGPQLQIPAYFVKQQTEAYANATNSPEAFFQPGPAQLYFPPSPHHGFYQTSPSGYNMGSSSQNSGFIHAAHPPNMVQNPQLTYQQAQGVAASSVMMQMPMPSGYPMMVPSMSVQDGTGAGGAVGGGANGGAGGSNGANSDGQSPLGSQIPSSLEHMQSVQGGPSQQGQGAETL